MYFSTTNSAKFPAAFWLTLFFSFVCFKTRYFSRRHFSSSNLELPCFERLQPLQNYFVMGVLLLQLYPMSATALSESRVSFAAKYRIVQKTLAAAHGSPTGSQKATGVRPHTQKSAQHKGCRRENSERQWITRVTSKNVNRPQTDVARSQDHTIIIYNTLLGHFSTASHRSNTKVLARRLIGTCIGLSSSRTLTRILYNFLSSAFSCQKANIDQLT